MKSQLSKTLPVNGKISITQKIWRLASGTPSWQKPRSATQLKTILVLLLILVVSSGVWGQSASWNYVSATGTLGTTYSWVDCSGGTTITFSDNDDGRADVAWPFGFTFYNNSYTTANNLSVSTNGFIRLNGNASNTASDASGYDLSTGGTSLGQIIALGVYDNQVQDNGGWARYLVSGSSPNRVFTIEYNNTEIDYNDNDFADIQVSFYETTNTIVLKIGDDNVARANVDLGICSGVTSYYSYWGNVNTLTNNTWIEYTPNTPPNTGDYRTAQDGTWSDRNDWQRWDGDSWETPTGGQGYPGQSGVPARVTIRNGHDMVINVTPANNIGSLEIGEGTSGTLQTDGTNRTLTLGSLQIAAGASFDMERTTLTVNGTSSISGTLNDNDNNGSGTFVGLVTINNTGSFTPTANSTLTFQGGITNNGTFTKAGTGSTTFNTNNQTISGSNTLTFSNGDFIISDPASLNVTTSISFSGTNFTNNSNNATAAFSQTAGTFTFALGNAQTINNGSGTGTVTFYNLTLDGSGTKTAGRAFNVSNDLFVDDNVSLTLSQDAGIFNVGGNLTVFQGSNDSYVNLNSGVTLNVAGTTSLNSNSNSDEKSIMVDAGTFTTGSLTVNSDGDTRDAYVRISTGTVTVTGDITLNSTNLRTYILFTDNGTLYIGGNMTGGGITSTTGGGTVAPTVGTIDYNGTSQNIQAYTYYNLNISGTGTFNATGAITVNGDFDISGDGTLNTGSNLTFSGTSQCNGAINASGGTVTYGANALNVIEGTYSTLLKSGATTSTLCGSITVNTALQLGGGIISLGNYDLTISNGAVMTPTVAFSSTNMVATEGAGNLIKQSNAEAGFEILYPVGSSGYYTPMSLTNGFTATPAGTGSVSVRAVTDAVGTNMLNKYWQVATTNLSSISSARILFTYNDAEINGTESSYVTWVEPDGGSWKNPTNPTITIGSNTFGSTGSSDFAGRWSAGISPLPIVTWYAYSTDGDWANASSWTLDGALSPLYENPSSLTPAATDIVVIPSGKKITISAGNDNLTVLKAEVNGTLDLTTSTGHDFGIIAGNGTIKTTAAVDNFPAGTANLFNDATNGGTFEINGAGISLNTARTFNNLKINLTSGSATLLADYTLNGNLTVTKGDFKINDASNTTPLNLTVAKDVLVTSLGSITVGTANATGSDAGYGNYHKYFHVFTVSGNFTNQGSVRLTNQTAGSGPDYTARTATGAISLVFNGLSNNTLSCEGITDLYYLVLDKGTDQTYSLTVNATAKNYFSLFGDNDEQWDATDDENPENRKALWIKAGSLILEGYVYIPTLGEGTRDWTIGANAALILNGPNVFVSTTAITAASGVHPAIDYSGLSYSSSSGIDNGVNVQAIYVNGTLKINDGLFTTSNTHGVVYRAESTANKLEINGGTVTTGQFRISGDASAATAKMSYVQTGGTLNLVDNQTDAAIFDLSAGLGFFNRSGGTINIQDLSGGATNAIYIACAENNIDVTGGTIILNNTTGTNADATISTTAPFHNFILRENRTSNVLLQTGLTVNNDLIIEKRDFNAAGFNLSIGSDLNISSGATYTTGSNTTTFTGAKQSNLYLPALQTFNNLTIAKTVEDKDLVIASGLSTALQVNGAFRLENGILDYNTYTVELKGSIYLADTIGKSTSTGKITINGGSTQTITSENGCIQSIDIDNTNGINLIGGLGIIGTLTLTNGIFNISTYKLSMVGADAAFGGTFDITRMIQTAGNASDGGIEMYVDADETLTYPLGTNANATIRYTPVEATFSGFSDAGYVQIHPSDNALATTNSTGGNLLSYYWRVNHTGFETIPTVQMVFNYAESDVVGADAAYVAGYVLDASPYTRSYEDVSVPEDEGIDAGLNTITFDGQTDAGFTLENANFTAGVNTRFNGTVDTYYSYYDSEGATGNGWYTNWNSAATWDKGSKGSGVHEVPSEGSIVYIMDRARVWGNVIPNKPAEVIFVYNLADYPVPDQENVPRLQFQTAGTFNLGIVKDTGMISINTSTLPTVNADWGEFANILDAYIMYWGGDITLNNVIQPCPTLMLESATFNIDQNITINGDLILTGSTVTPLQDINIGRNLYIGAWSNGVFNFPGTGSSVTVTVEGNLDYTYITTNTPRNVIVNNPGVASTLEHKLIVKGDIIHGSNNAYSLDLYNAANRPAVILELQGNSNNNYHRTSTSVPDLYRLIINKGDNQTNSFSFDDSFVLNGPTSGVGIAKALELVNGTLILNDAAIDINLSTGDDDFEIPSTANLTLTQGTARVNGASTGITLDGGLTINGGTLNMESGTETYNNYIQYGSSGNANINISSGSLLVGNQIRRLTTSSAGVLNYNQSGGTVTIGVNTGGAGYVANRGMLEIVNTGSNFSLSGAGTLTFVRQNGAAPEVAALYLDPDTYDITGSTIVIGNANTPASQNLFNINSSVALHNLSINPNAVAGLQVNLATQPLTIAGNLTINTNGTFDGKGLNLTLQGNLINNGTYTASNNTLIFNSNAAQGISGTGTEDIYRFTKTGSGTLTLSKNITVNDLLDVDLGTFHTDTYTLNVNGNVTLDASITSTSGNGLAFGGSALQNLARSGVGQSSMGIVTINNSNGVKVSDTGHSFIITNKLRLQSGVFNIGGSLLEFGTTATIEEVSPFSITNMIQTNSSFQDNGVKKNFPANHTTDFIFPVGQLLYTPVTIDLSSPGHTIGTTAGNLTVRPANEYHPTINDPTNYFDPLFDIDNVLQYYWILRASNITGFVSDVTMVYDDSDVLSSDPSTDETDYISARILTNNNPTEAVSKYSTAEVDETTNTITFTFNGDNSDGITGDYFAGNANAIPDNVVTYTTTGTGGNVNASSTYIGGLPTDGVAPTGAVLIVSSGDEVNFNVDDVKLYKTEIQAGGTLTINETQGHRLGTVTGTGNIKIVSSTASIAFPAGDYIDFFDCTGGGIDYAGTGSYTVMSGFPSVRNLTISGSGTKELANNDIVVCEDFTINGPTFDNPSDNDITVNRDMFISSGVFNSGASNIIEVAGTVTVNGGTYNGETSGSDTFGALTVSSGTFNLGSGGSVSIEGDITFSGGTFNGGTGAAKIVLDGSSNQNITGTFTGASKIRNLEINNTSGATMLGSVTVDNSLTLTNGLITTGSNTLLLNSGATITPANGTSTKYVNGKLSKVLANVGDDFVFPVGKSGKWGYAGVYNVTTGGLTWDVEYFATGATNEALVNNFTPTNTSITGVTQSEYWKISDSGSSQANIALSWNSESNVSAIQSEREKLEVMVWNDGISTWDNKGGGSFSSGHTQIEGSFLSTSLIQFSENIITLGSSDINNPLPVELLYFTGKANTEDVVLLWATASEKNNDYFEVQRSTDAEEFETIGKVFGNGNSLIQNDYNFVDENPQPGTSYYRLKQVDYNGASEIHKTVAVYYERGYGNSLNKDISIYPNPYNSGNLILDLQELEPNTSILVSVINMNEKVIVTVPLLIPESREVNLVPKMIDNLSPGIYVVTVRTPKGILTKKVIVN